MGRAPCCEKMGLKRGPWTPEEDQLLVAYIQKFGHGNWRALPKLAGLLRCGKSCRLRWTNYLRPDIKRGNFTKEEEETIIKLHELLGNRWSTIAARLPGRTDNEIKNVWHTHLKKRLKQTDELTSDTAVIKPDLIIKCESNHILGSEDSNSNSKFENQPYAPLSPPQPSSSDISSGTESATTVENQKVTIKDEYTTMDSWQTLPQTENEHLWSDVIPMEQFLMMDEAIKTEPSEVQFPVSSSLSTQSSMIDDGIDFWNDLFANSEELPELPEF